MTDRDELDDTPTTYLAATPGRGSSTPQRVAEQRRAFDPHRLTEQRR